MEQWRKLTSGEKKLARVKREQTEAITRRTNARVAELNSPGGSSSVDKGGPQHKAKVSRQARIGRGQIDRYGAPKLQEQHTQTTAVFQDESSSTVDFPPPTPDPNCNPPLSRATRLKQETAIWTGVVQEEGRLELCRTNKTGNQEWISAIEIEPRQWQITKSRTTSRFE